MLQSRAVEKIVTENSFYSSPFNFVSLRSGIENCEIIISSDNFCAHTIKSPASGGEVRREMHTLSFLF